MAELNGLKLYLAGPEVFLRDAVEHAEKQRKLCTRFGFVPLHPMDNNLDLVNSDMKTAMQICKGDVNQVKECDIVVANCNDFRGVCMDDGTAVEIGLGIGLGKVVYGYMSDLSPLNARTVHQYPCSKIGEDEWMDKEGYVLVDDFGTSRNLMVQCGVELAGGRFVEGDFEACLKQIRQDLDSGFLTIPS